MSTIPSWWLALSGLFFVLNSALFVILGLFVIRLGQMAQDLKPKIDEISTKVSHLTTTVEGVAVKLDELTVSLKQNVDGVGSRSQNILASVEQISGTASRQFEKFSPLVVGALTVFRLFRAVGDMRKGRHQAEEDRALAKRGRRR
jgi:uncharacterized protein YoxC